MVSRFIWENKKNPAASLHNPNNVGADRGLPFFLHDKPRSTFRAECGLLEQIPNLVLHSGQSTLCPYVNFFPQIYPPPTVIFPSNLPIPLVGADRGLPKNNNTIPY